METYQTVENININVKPKRGRRSKKEIENAALLASTDKIVESDTPVFLSKNSQGELHGTSSDIEFIGNGGERW